MRKIIITFIGCCALLILAACGPSESELAELDQNIIDCGNETHICTDGTLVIREGELCEFQACPGEADVQGQIEASASAASQ